MQHYVIHGEDVRACPNEKCGYAGIVQLNPDSQRIDCADPLECEKCGTKWKDPMQASSSKLDFMRYLLDQIPSYESLANNLTTILTAKPCPNCGVMVQKNGGCQKMVCAKCNFVFCWICMQNYASY